MGLVGGYIYTRSAGVNSEYFEELTRACCKGICVNTWIKCTSLTDYPPHMSRLFVSQRVSITSTFLSRRYGALGS